MPCAFAVAVKVSNPFCLNSGRALLFSQTSKIPSSVAAVSPSQTMGLINRSNPTVLFNKYNHYKLDKQVKTSNNKIDDVTVIQVKRNYKLLTCCYPIQHVSAHNYIH